MMPPDIPIVARVSRPVMAVTKFLTASTGQETRATPEHRTSLAPL